MSKKKVLSTLGLILFLLLTGCSHTVQTIPMTDSELAQAKVYAEPMVNNLMKAMQSRIYDDFSKDFNPTMHDVLAKSNFEEMMKTFDEKIGACSLNKFNSAVKMNANFALTYDLTCTKDNSVQMQVLFEPNDPHLIAGLFFTSPRLNQ